MARVHRTMMTRQAVRVLVALAAGLADAWLVRVHRTAMTRQAVRVLEALAAGRANARSQVRVHDAMTV